MFILIFLIKTKLSQVLHNQESSKDAKLIIQIRLSLVMKARDELEFHSYQRVSRRNLVNATKFIIVGSIKNMT